MQKVVSWVFVALLFISRWVCPCHATTRYLGTYLLHVELLKSDRSSNDMIGTINIEASIPSGQGFVILPLPFSIERASSVAVEVNGSNTSVLRGDVDPEHRYGVILVTLGRETVELRATIRGVEFHLNDSTFSESGKVAHFLARRAFHVAADSFPDSPLASLLEVHIRPPSLGETTPASSVVSGIDRVIRYSTQEMPTSDVLVHLHSTTVSSPSSRQSSSLYGLYILLGGLGVFLGWYGSPKIPAARVRIISIISVIGLIFIAISVVFLRAELLMHDTTTVVTIGTAGGICMAGLFRACQTLAVMLWEQFVSWATRRKISNSPSVGGTSIIATTAAAAAPVPATPGSENPDHPAS